MDQSNLLLDGAANTAPDDQQDQSPQPQPLSAVAQMAYDRYGVLDPVKLDLMIRGIFISREDAAALPNRITPDGRPEPNSLHASHHSRAPRSSSTSSHHRNHHATAAAARRPAAAATTAGAGIVKRLGVAARLREASVPPPPPSSSSSSAGSRGGAGDIGAGPSDHEKWGEGEVELIIRMKAERIGFRYIAERFPGKSQKAVQEKFYKTVKDQKNPHWKRLYHQLRTRHDRIAVFNNGTVENPIEISSDEGTARQPIEISSGTVSEATTVAEPEEERAEAESENGEADMKDVKVKMAD